MKLREFEGKEYFRRYGIPTPGGILVSSAKDILQNTGRCVVKAQVLSGDRKKVGGIKMARSGNEARALARAMFGKKINGEKVTQILIDEHVDAVREYYVSFSYDDATKGPVLVLNPKGGSGISKAKIFSVALEKEMTLAQIKKWLGASRFPAKDIGSLAETILKLWTLFITEHALLAEINPLFRTKGGTLVAGDAKVTIDDEKINPSERRYIEMHGDIAILASGGGASMLNMDALVERGGKPANYCEYSGNPPAEIVKELTKRVLSKPGLKGCWVVGAAANFTDIYTTLSGFLEGLREVTPKPTYPIVIRRDGPRSAEAFEMLRNAGKIEGYDFHLFGSDTPMILTAGTMVALAYKKKPKTV